VDDVDGKNAAKKKSPVKKVKKTKFIKENPTPPYQPEPKIDNYDLILNQIKTNKYL
jgi:hypothetical protein